MPFEDQASGWKERDREKYFDILSECDEVITLNNQYHRGCYHERNRYMVDNSSRLVCCYDESGGGTRYTVEYAKGTSVYVISIYDSGRVHEGQKTDDINNQMHRHL